MDSAKEKIKGYIEGYRQTALLALACQSGILDSIESGCRTAEQLAIQRGWSKSALVRILRGFVLLGLIEYTPAEKEGQVSLLCVTELGRLLTTQSGGPERFYSLLSLNQYVSGWMSISAALTETDTPFQKAFGMSVWELRRGDSVAGDLFNTWLSKQTSDHIEPIIQFVDLRGVEKVVDIGGGTGALLRGLLQMHPRLCGILADQAEVVESIQSYQVHESIGNRFETVAVNFFESVPSGCDAYLLKSVLHDWEDEDCGRILRVIAKAMQPGAKLFIIERLIPENPEADPSTIWIDLHMLCITGGKERNEREYAEILSSNGFRLGRVIKTASPFYVLEAYPICGQ